ncbi:MAG: hypothetical protein IJR42_04135 [Paludibacteraceae bacterium]|nr:hypothetical protein [Paludibacteraceae bacterium]
MNKQGKYLLALLFVCFVYTLPAQTRAEFWIDADPGHGKAAVVTVNADAASVDIPTGPLSYGWHIAGIRVHQSRWSQTYTHRFFKIAPQAASALSGAEYWVNNDPGQGNAIAIPFAAGQTELAVNIPTEGLDAGFHIAGLRVRYGNQWSQTYTHRFFIAPQDIASELSAAEYWLDADPGLGNAFSLAVSAGQNNISLDILQLDTLTEGFHTLGVRMRYGNVWSQTYTHRFFRTEKHVIKTQIEAIEAYWDADTTHVAVVPFVQDGDSVVVEEYDFPTDTLSYGIHYLYIHAKANGVWSIINRYEVCKNAIPQFSVLQDTICLGDELIILDESQDVQPETTYAWDVDGDGKTDYTDKGDLVHAFSKAGKYNVTLTLKTDEGCESVYSHEVVIQSKSAPSISLSRTKSNSCAGESVTFTATPTNGGDRPVYTWLRNGVAIAGAAEAVLTLNDLQDKDTIQVQLTTSNRCAETKTALSSRLIQTVYALPVIEFLLSETYYTDENAFSLTGKATPAGGKFYINDAEVKLFNPKANEVGTYTIRYVVTNSNGCTSEAEMSFELKVRGGGTGLEDVQGDNVQCTKVLINGQIFILRGEKVYTLTGQEVK